MKPFYARFGVNESIGLDVFSVDWSRGVGYFHPPVSQIWRVIRKAEREKAKGFLVVPDWPGSSLLAVLERRLDEGKVILKYKWRPWLVCPQEIVSNTFRGQTKFYMNIYCFNFG